MGLLTKASGSNALNSETADEMGKALCDRIRRLPQKSSTPYTALSLLKAYGGFQSGVCLALKNNVYSSYTSVGLGIVNISIPQEKLWSEERAQVPYFRLDSGVDLGINTGKEGFSYWIFPLNSLETNPSEPWKKVMILDVLESSEANSAFSPKSISAIISNTADKFFIEPDRNDSEPVPETNPAGPSSEKPTSKEQDELEEKIAEYHLNHVEFNCIVLEIPPSSGEDDKTNFSKKVSEILNTLGSVMTLSTGCPLILLPKMTDRELIAHRLSKVLNTRPLLSFEANSPENVFSRINSLL